MNTFNKEYVLIAHSHKAVIRTLSLITTFFIWCFLSLLLIVLVLTHVIDLRAHLSDLWSMVLTGLTILGFGVVAFLVFVRHCFLSFSSAFRISRVSII